MSLNGKIAIITGGSGGMGRETAFLLAQSGVKLALAARGIEGLSETVTGVEALGGEAFACPGNVSKSADVQNIVRETLRRFGKIDFLICTAGIGIFGPVVEFSESDWVRVMDVNLKGVFLCCKEVLPTFLKQKKGHIINIASLAGTVGSPNLAAYCASKAGLICFSDALSKEVRSDGIKVSTITPGSTNTDFGGSAREKQSWKMSPKDIANMVYNLLVSPDNLLISNVHMRPLKTSL